MKAAFLIKHGSADSAFEIRETDRPTPKAGEVLIRVDAFGLNFADVQARLGLYKAAPPPPSILGYDVVGYVDALGDGVQSPPVGSRVVALTKFGGYAEYAVAQHEVTQVIPKDLPPGVAVALATQYCTAFFLAHRMANIQSGDRVLIHAAAGGVGTALTQMALNNNCTVFGTCSSIEKIEYLQKNGVHHPINYIKEDFEDSINNITGKDGLDAIFDPVGGISVKKDFRLLGTGGRVITFGVSSMNKAKSIFGKIKVLLQFGFYHPIQFLSNSKGMIGVNMLSIAENRPEKIGDAMSQVIQWCIDDKIHPHVGGDYSIAELSEAHHFLESRKSMGKIVVRW